jgi:hypothetical protein
MQQQRKAPLRRGRLKCRPVGAKKAGEAFVSDLAPCSLSGKQQFWKTYRSSADQVLAGWLVSSEVVSICLIPHANKAPSDLFRASPLRAVS